MKRDERLLLVSLGMLLAFLIGELVAALIAHSLTLLADAGHMATDVLALAAAVVAARLARRPAQGHWTFGLARAEVLSAAFNGITLLVVAAIVTVEAIRRLINPVESPAALSSSSPSSGSRSTSSCRRCWRGPTGARSTSPASSRTC